LNGNHISFLSQISYKSRSIFIIWIVWSALDDGWLSHVCRVHQRETKKMSFICSHFTRMSFRFLWFNHYSKKILFYSLCYFSPSLYEIFSNR
jgi:hypothetical protein